MREAPSEQDIWVARRARMVGIVIAATTVLWLVGQSLGQQFQWQARWAYLFDFIAIAAFIWALVVTYRIWRVRRG